MQSPRNIVVTGGNSGIGLYVVKGLYEDGNNVIFGSRNQQKNEEVVKDITKKQGGTLKCFPLDLSKRQSIDDFVKNIKDNFSHIDILVNNAGLVLQEKAISQLGIEMTYTINHFGPFYMTYSLFDSIKKAKQGRIINVSSIAHQYTTDNFLDDLACDKKFDTWDQYNNSKLMNVLFAVGLNNLFKQKNLNSLKSASLHPGIVSTGFGTDSCAVKFLRCCCCCIVKESEGGSGSALHLCRIPFGEVKSGEYYDDDSSHKQMHKKGRDQALVKKLWEISEKAYGIKFD